MAGFIEFLTNLLLRICFNIKELTVAVISMFPIIELKGGIPVGVKLGLGVWDSFLWAFIGTSFVCILLLFLLPILFKIPILQRVKQVFQTKADKIPEQWKIFGLFLLTFIPLPGTGVWTASIVTTILSVNIFAAALTIIVGNFFSGIAIVGLTALIGKSNLDLLLFILLVCFVLLLALFFFKFLRQKPQADNAETTSEESN